MIYIYFMRMQNTKTLPAKEKEGKHIELNEYFLRALDSMENSSRHVFITGKAGTGKSTLLQHFRDNTRKKVAVIAPTGVAALNINGQTIHSFFGFRPDVTLNAVGRYEGPHKGLYKALDTIVIDEISMVRADMLDCIDRFLRINGKSSKEPFGGVQMVFIGDLYQLPPVVTGNEREIFRKQYQSQYFFDSAAFRQIDMEFIELEKVYRQTDRTFIDILNSIRNNSITEKELQELNKRVDPWFEPKPDDFYIHLTTTNDLAAEINQKELSKIKARPCSYKGEISGNFDMKHLPTDVDLTLKTGSQIMMVNNDSMGRWVNGTVGRIKEIEEGDDEDTVWVELPNGKTADVYPYTWNMFRLHYNKKRDFLESESTGSFTQFPLRLAWAVTIHKSQGKTFDRVIIDIGRGTFTHGQAYVALSRCTGLGGIVLKQPLLKKHIFMDWKVVRFLTSYQYKRSEKVCSTDEKIRIIKNAIQNRSKLDIVYLKANDEKSKRTIQPNQVGRMVYLGKPYIGVEAFCYKRKEDRIFRVDRILELQEAKTKQ